MKYCLENPSHRNTWYRLFKHLQLFEQFIVAHHVVQYTWIHEPYVIQYARARLRGVGLVVLMFKVRSIISKFTSIIRATLLLMASCIDIVGFIIIPSSRFFQSFIFLFHYHAMSNFPPHVVVYLYCNFIHPSSSSSKSMPECESTLVMWMTFGYPHSNFLYHCWSFLPLIVLCWAEKLNIDRIGCISREPDQMKTDRLGPDQIRELDPRGAGRPLEAYAPSLVGSYTFGS